MVLPLLLSAPLLALACSSFVFYFYGLYIHAVKDVQKQNCFNVKLTKNNRLHFNTSFMFSLYYLFCMFGIKLGFSTCKKTTIQKAIFFPGVNLNNLQTAKFGHYNTNCPCFKVCIIRIKVKITITNYSCFDTVSAYRLCC